MHGIQLAASEHVLSRLRPRWIVRSPRSLAPHPAHTVPQAPQAFITRRIYRRESTIESERLRRIIQCGKTTNAVDS